MMMLLIAALLQVRQEATTYYSDSYSPSYLIRRQPWQAIAVDSENRIYIAHPFDKTAGNQPVPSGRRLQVFSPQGDLLAQYRDPDGIATYGLAIDEAQHRIYGAANMNGVATYSWDGPTIVLQKNAPSPAIKEGGRCVGVARVRGGGLLTADLADNKVFRFYSGGGYSSFGSGPGGGDQGFNDLRRVFESPVDGSLVTLDADGVRKFSPIGQFLKRIGKPTAPHEGILAMGPDGRLLVGDGGDLQLIDGDGKLLKTLPIATKNIVDAALGKDGKVYVMPRGEEYGYAAYDAEGKLLLQRGADFDRLTVTLPGSTLRAGAKVPATVVFSNALKAGLLSGAEQKTAAARPQSPRVSVYVSGAEWSALEGTLAIPAGVEGSRTLRFTTAASAEGPGLRVDFKVTISR
jgi:hypothetical protein